MSPLPGELRTAAHIPAEAYEEYASYSDPLYYERTAMYEDGIDDGEPVSIALPEEPTFGGEIDRLADRLLAPIPLEDMLFYGKFEGTRRDYGAYAIRPTSNSTGHTLRSPRTYPSFLDAYDTSHVPLEYLLYGVLPTGSLVESEALESSNILRVQQAPSGEVVLSYGYIGAGDAAGRPTKQSFVMKLQPQQLNEALTAGQPFPLLIEAMIRRSPLGQAIRPHGAITDEVDYGIGRYREANKSLVMVNVPLGFGAHYDGNRAGDILGEVVNRRIKDTQGGARAYVVEYVPPRPQRTPYVDSRANEPLKESPQLSVIPPLALLQSAFRRRREEEEQRRAALERRRAERNHEDQEDREIQKWLAIKPSLHQLDEYSNTGHANFGYRVDTYLFHPRSNKAT